MHRLRITIISTAMMASLAVFTHSSMAQDPGGAQGGGGGGGRGRGAGGQGGFGGGPGGFGGGPGGFGGGPGGSVLNLATNEAVQEELKLKDPQKAKIKSLVDSHNERQRALRAQMNPGGGPGGPGGQAGQGQGAGGQGGQAQGAQGGRGRNRNGGNVQAGAGGGDQGAGGGGGQGGQNGGGGGQGGQNGGGGRGNRRQLTPEEQEARAQIADAMQQLQRSSEQSLIKIIGTSGYARIKQIQLQLQGPQALLQEEMIEKLNISEEQVEQLRELINGRRQAQREEMRARFDLMKSAFPQPPDANGGNGGRGGNGPNFRDPAFQDAMKAFMEKPEVKQKMADFQTQQEKQEAMLMAAVHRTLGKRQDANYKKLLGAPFDLSKIRGGGPGRGFGRNGGNQPAAAKDAANPKAAAGFDDENTSSKTTTTGTKQATPAAKTKKRSLAEERGLDE